MRTILPTVLLTLAIACGSSEPAPEAPPPATDPDTPVSSDDVGPGGTVTDTGDPLGPCSAGGVPDDGDAEGCDFRVAGCCYDTADRACAAAGCPLSSCQILESYPAQIRCE